MDLQKENQHAILIGAGIMSATLAIFLKELEPGINIDIYERLPAVAAESSDGWNNAGTGHSAFCELNYTPENDDGSIDISKALKIAASFETSKQFWSTLVQQNKLGNPNAFIHSVPHMSFVWGKENVDYLKKRHEALTKFTLFKGMKYSEDNTELAAWMPLIMQGRDEKEQHAATRMEIGTDINFGALTEAMLKYLGKLDGVNVYTRHEVKDIVKQQDGRWKVTVEDFLMEEKRRVTADFIFIGAGGGTLSLLEKSDIEEARGYGGFPISGQWLRCTNEAVIAKHNAKVYGKASVGAPPMSVPHLDTRVIDGKKELLFGPYAGFSTKFLKNGSYLDLPLSIELDNIFPMLSAGWHNLPLTKYLVQQVTQSDKDRLEALQEYYPEADGKDWELAIAGQRVQVIKKDKEEGGVLEFGTEVVNAADGTLSALLGASPGASTAVSIMLDVLKKCFPQNMETDKWQSVLKTLIPAYGKSLADNDQLAAEQRERSKKLLLL